MIGHDRVGDVAVLTLDRPDRRNALDIEHCVALRDAVEEAAAAGARALVITGAGTSFCSGADFGEVYGEGFRDALYAALRAIRRCPLPVVAAVNGPAIGAGTQLVIACDLRVAGDAAVFAVPTARIGLAVDPWTIRRLATLAGAGVAAALLVGCEQIDVATAHACGLVNRIGGVEAACDWAAEIAVLAPLTLAYSKQALHELAPAEVSPELNEAFERCWSSADLEEAQRARAERREPVFRGV